MNNEELKELAAVLNGIADGKEWEREGIVGKGNFGKPYWGPMHYIQQGAAIRLKQWHLPEPPHGYEWHRTDWTEEMLPDGWRPLLVGECLFHGDQLMGCYGWELAKGLLGNKASRMRTRRPLPPPKPHMREVELCADDVLPGSALRFNEWVEDGCWMMVAGNGLRTVCGWINGNLISLAYGELLAKGVEINRSILLTGKWDATAWEKCSKMEEVPA